ncbi:MAG: 2-hydroxyacyl-CoA dehydratase [Clostridiales bacterium]|nr:2-hydroxyacyl-CoA dehydratase [Clostridiales bacterium]
MSDLLAKLSDYVYETVPVNPKKALNIMSFGYSAFGLRCRLPKKPFMPARLYMNRIAASATVGPLRHPENAMLTNIFMPCEIFQALEMNIMFPEAIACCLAFISGQRAFIESAEANGIPPTLCSYHKCLIGLALTGVMPKPLFIVNTTLACDANQLSFRRLEEYYGIKRKVIDVPYEDNEENLEHLVRQLKETAIFAQENSSKTLTEEKLALAIARSKRTIENYKEYLELRADRHIYDNMTSEMLAVFATHVLLGSEQAEKFTADLVEQTRKIPVTKHSGVRLLWVHTLPFWQPVLRELLNLNDRCEVVACDMTFDGLCGTQESDPYRYMAKRLISNSFNGSSDRRIELVAEYAKKLNADGVVWYCHWGCKQTAGASASAKEYFEQAGIPVLILDGDGCDRNNVNDGQTATRMEAFIELLEKKA